VEEEKNQSSITNRKMEAPPLASSQILKSFEDKAQALLTLKGNLGPFFDEQKKQLLDQLLKSGLPFPDVALLLKKLMDVSFIDGKELADLTTKLIAGSVPEKNLLKTTLMCGMA
jgi:hypothetical protein